MISAAVPFSQGSVLSVKRLNLICRQMVAVCPEIDWRDGFSEGRWQVVAAMIKRVTIVLGGFVSGLRSKTICHISSPIVLVALAANGCTQVAAPRSATDTTVAGSTATPEASPSAARQSFELNSGRSLGLVVPDGWAARAYQTQHSIRGVILEPQGDLHLETDAKSLAAGGSAAGAHVIIIESGEPCVGDQWALGPVQTAPDAGATITGRKASLSSEGVTCAHAKAADRETNADLSAVKVLEKLTEGNAVVTKGH
ncbi:hypothetical protein ACNO8X_16380 [Mycobacterium sp. PDNC021]|uniref:hypothetical protein n=1 Tax=Mycobacterium sp. PDNC021 TaxID=3391399 RepID=UPI003AABECD9